MTFAIICMVIGAIVLGLAIYAGRNDGSGAAILFLISFAFIGGGAALAFVIWIIKNAFA